MNFTPKNPRYKEAIQEVLDKQHFMKHIGFELTLISPGYMEGEIPFKEFLKQQAGFLHGGVIATLSDLVCGFAAYSLVPENEYVVTGDLKISYFNPGTGSRFVAKGKVLKAGSRMIFCEAEIIDGDSGLFIAKSSATMVIVPKQNNG
jgi:uncharacterized protein (TIGR00369 family)